MYAAGSSTRYAAPRVIFARCLENLFGETRIEWELIRDHRKRHLPFGEILVSLHENVNSRIRLIFRGVILHEDNGVRYCLGHFVWIQKTGMSKKSFVEFHLQTTLSENSTNFPIAGKRSTKMLICFWTSASPPCSVCFNSALFKSMIAFWSDLKASREQRLEWNNFYRWVSLTWYSHKMTSKHWIGSCRGLHRKSSIHFENDILKSLLGNIAPCRPTPRICFSQIPSHER